MASFSIERVPDQGGRIMPWTAWLGWTLLFALIYWGVQVVQAFLGDWLGAGGLNDVVQVAGLLIPLLAAFLIGARLREWGWVLGPPVAIVLTMLTYPIVGYVTASQTQRQQMGTGLILATAGILIGALVAMIAAAVGVWFGKAR
jgi:hypothetical protein